MNGYDVQTLEIKVRQFADALTPIERAQLRTLRPEDVADGQAPSLRAKAQAAAQGLTDEERARLQLVGRRVGEAAAATNEADAQGFRAALYEDAYGWKGRPGTGGESGPQGGAGGGGGFGAAQILIGMLTLGAALGGAGYGEPGDYLR